jgi:hypothetical protein
VPLSGKPVAIAFTATQRRLERIARERSINVRARVSSEPEPALGDYGGPDDVNSAGKRWLVAIADFAGWWHRSAFDVIATLQ